MKLLPQLFTTRRTAREAKRRTIPPKGWLFLAALLLASAPLAARADIILYTDEGTFNAATAKLQFVEDTYEGIAPAGEQTFDFPYPNPIGYLAHNSLSGGDYSGLAIADANYWSGRLSLNGSSSLVAAFDTEYPPETVEFSFNQPATACSFNFGLINPYGPNDPRSLYPRTDYVTIQVYGDTPTDFDVPLGEVYNASFPINSFVGFVSTTTPITKVRIVQNHPQDYFDPDTTNKIYDYYQMVFDNVRFAQTPTLPTVTVIGSSPDANTATGQAGDFVVTLSAVAATDLKVTYTVKGSATPRVDYVALKGTVKIKAGQTSKKIPVVPKGNLGGADKKVVKLTLQPGTGYIVGTPNPVKLKISREP